jgi:hypothetical protein
MNEAVSVSQRRGRIYGSKNSPWKQAVHPLSENFRSAADLVEDVEAGDA